MPNNMSYGKSELPFLHSVFNALELISRELVNSLLFHGYVHIAQGNTVQSTAFKQVSSTGVEFNKCLTNAFI